MLVFILQIVLFCCLPLLRGEPVGVNCSDLNYPRQYVSYKLRPGQSIKFDGKLNDAAWLEVPFSDLFLDIEGPSKPRPYDDTRMKMRWDDNYLYIGGWMEEPQAWANLTYNNSVIFRDNDFEVFIDVDGSNHYYKELELNALSLNWNLLLVKPYLNGGPPVCNFTEPNQCQGSAPGVPYWDISPELLSAVSVVGAINDPTKGSKSWSIEIGIPIDLYLKYCPTRPSPPTDGTYWRIDFSRVEWHVIVGGQPPAYWKNPAFPQPENWVWQPTYVSPPDMHLPETWGYLQFSTAPVNTSPLRKDPQWPARDALMKLYYAETLYNQAKGHYSTNLTELSAYGLPNYVRQGYCVGVPSVTLDSNGQFTATVVDGPRTGHIQADRLLWFDSPHPLKYLSI